MKEHKPRMVVVRGSVVCQFMLETGRWIVAALQPPALRPGMIELEYVHEPATKGD